MKDNTGLPNPITKFAHVFVRQPLMTIPETDRQVFLVKDVVRRQHSELVHLTVKPALCLSEIAVTEND
jgi:hypothetical protein